MEWKREVANAVSLACWNLGPRQRGWPLIHVVGDSHTKVFSGSPGFIVHHLGPATAYQLRAPRSSLDSHRRLWAAVDRMNRRRDVLLLSFGEVDCRIHIYQQHRRRERRVSMEDLMDETVARYGSVMEDLHARGVRFGILGPPPATRQPNRYGVAFYATPDIHRFIYAEFNRRLADHCREHGRRFMDIYTKTVDEGGFARTEYAADHTHLNRRVIPFVRTWVAAEFVNPPRTHGKG